MASWDPISDDQFPRLPRFRLIRKLSETTLSVVYLAEEKAAGDRLVAVKVLAPALADEGEIRRAAALDHHNIVPVYAVGEPLHVVMPYVPGPNLRDLLRAGPLAPGLTVHIVREVASALDFAHAAGVLHLDVKPSNVLVDEETGRVLLCDFGIAAPVPGRRVGTPGHVAPELVCGDEAGPRADVYSLGVVLYRCLTGRPPHGYRDAGELLWAQVHEDPLAVTAVRPELPRALNKVLANALAKRPERRYATCAELAEALANALPV